MAFRVSEILLLGFGYHLDADAPSFVALSPARLGFRCLGVLA